MFPTCVSILGHVHVPSEFELRCVVYLRSHIRSICVPFRCFPFVFHFCVLFLYLLHSVHYQSVQIRVIAVCVLFNVCFLFFYHLMVPFKAHLIFFFLRNSMQFLSRWSCISKRKTTFEDILKCYQSHSNQGLNKLRRVRCWNGDVLEISLLVNLSFWLEIWSVFYVQWIQKWLKYVLIQKRRLL